MQIQGLSINQISQKIEPYVGDYFKGFTLSSFNEMSFESYIFDYEEVKHLILEQYRHQFVFKSGNESFCSSRILLYAAQHIKMIDYIFL